MARKLFFCFGCYSTFGRKAHLIRHHGSQCSDSELSQNRFECYPTTCGRMGPLLEPIVHDIVEDEEERLTVETTAPYILENNGRVPAGLMLGTARYVELLEPLLSESEDAEDLVSIFAPLLGKFGESFSEVLSSEIVLFSGVVLDTEVGLTNLLLAGEQWLFHHARTHVSAVPADLRGRLSSFEAKDDEDTTTGAVFTFRRDVKRLWSELAPLLKYFYRLKLCLLSDLVDLVKESASVSELLCKAVVPNILVRLGLQSVSDISEVPWLVQFALARCFSQKHDKVLMIECGWAGSRVSAILHLLRVGVCGRLAAHRSWKWHDEAINLVRDVQCGWVTNILAPYVSRLRHSKSRKPPLKDNTTDADGNITSGAFTFPRSKWSQLVPIILETALGCLKEIFVGDDFEIFLNVGLCLVVADWYLLDATVSREGGEGTLKLKSLVARQNVGTARDKLRGIMEFCLHGMGCGSARYEEIKRLKVGNTQFHRDKVYYWTESIKSASIARAKRRTMAKLTEHCLPRSVSRIFVLYRYVCDVGLCQANSGVFGSATQQQPVLGGDSDASMMEFVSEVFQFSGVPTALNLRHFWTSITNVIFPSGGVERNGSMVAQDAVAEMSGHTAATHRMCYGTEKSYWREGIYDSFHAALGEVGQRLCSGHIGQFSRQQMLGSLKVLCGDKAEFNGCQERIVHFCCNSVGRHGYGALPCGHGKSMSWLVPLVSERMSGRRVGMRIVVLPYKFLLRHMVATTEEVLHRLGVVVMAVPVQDITECLFPMTLLGDDYPGLVYVTVDGMARMLVHHFGRLEELVRKGVLTRVYIDEAQQFLCEFGFRQAYEELRRVGALGVPVTVLSGSLGTDLAESLCSYLGLCGETSMRSTMDVVEMEDPVGNGFVMSSVVAVDVSTSVAKKTKERLKETTGHVHVICSTKEDCRSIENQLKKDRVPCEAVTSETEADVMARVAKDWYGGKIDVLVTTTVALVGNENERCRTIIVVGILFNASSVIQAIGRLRPKQRGDQTAVVLMRKKITSDDLTRWAEGDRNSFDVLLSSGVLAKTALQKSFDKAFGTMCLVQLLRKKTGCFLQGLRESCGCDSGKACAKCDLCVGGLSVEVPVRGETRESQVSRERRAAMQKLEREKSYLVLGRRVLYDLRFRCWNCKMSWCKGETCFGRICFKCGDRNHTSKTCNFDAKSILVGRGCYYCYEWYGNSPNHTPSTCPTYRRLRLLHFVSYRKENCAVPFQEWFRSVHSSQVNYYRMLSAFEKDVAVRRLRRGTIGVVEVIQISDEDIRAPLQPPNICHSEDQSAVAGRMRVIEYPDMTKAREAYNKLRKKKMSAFRRRSFVYGFFHQRIFKGSKILDSRHYDADLKVTCADGTTTMIYLRQLLDAETLDSLVKLGRCMPHTGNARRNSGDMGDMYGIGTRDHTADSTYVLTKGRETEIRDASSRCMEWLEVNLTDVLADISRAERSKSIKSPSWMPKGPGSSIMLSKNLGNSSHYDLDGSVSVSFWVEDKPGVASNWFFVLPNVSFEGSDGVLIRLYHGAVVSWDGRYIRHCTSVTETGVANNTYGVMFGSCR